MLNNTTGELTYDLYIKTERGSGVEGQLNTSANCPVYKSQ